MDKDEGRRMTRAHPIVEILLLGSLLYGQAPAGTISGRVTDPEGVPVADAFVQLKGTSTDATANTASAEDGRYSLRDLAAGTYDLSVNLPGMQAFKRSGIVLAAGQNLELNAQLEDGPSLRTLGEDPAAIAAVYLNRPDPPTGPAPRAAGGKPDLTGMWLSGPVELPALGMLPWAESLLKDRVESRSKDHPMARCLPSGPVPTLDAGFFQIVHTPALLLMMFESDTPGYRQVFLDGRSHPEGFGPTWLGHSVGRWEGETLVIDTVGFHGQGWLNFEGNPHSDRLHVVQRLRRIDLGQLEIQVTVDDPGAYEKPWTVQKTASLAPDEQILEYICNENNKDVAHMVGK
jgi:hypothetical protein